MSHTRDPSAARGRATDSSPGSLQSLQPQPQPRLRTQSHSKSPESVGTRSATSLDGEGLERRPSNSAYGHHRQASIVHGSIQHSRNASFAASSANPGPLSPEGIATAAYGVSHALDSPLNGKRDPQEYSSGYTGAGTPVTGHMQPATLTTIQDNHQAEIASEPTSQRKATTSGKSRRDHSHHPSHSSKHSQEARTVGEYALHHLFNSVCVPLP